MPIVPYCGAPPLPGSLWERWNGDPLLIAALIGLALFHFLRVRHDRRAIGLAGWGVAALAFLSPLCALSVSLFAARVGQHMILILVAAPMIGYALPRGTWRGSPWWSAAAFAVALWVWHMPVPYDATFRSDLTYWAMHATLFGTAILLWRDLLNHTPEEGAQALGAGTMASVAMGLLGAVLTLSSHPMFAWHFTTTEAWGMAPLADQQLGGALMWVPGAALFLWAAMRSTHMLWTRLEGKAPA